LIDFTIQASTTTIFSHLERKESAEANDASSGSRRVIYPSIAPKSDGKLDHKEMRAVSDRLKKERKVGEALLEYLFREVRYGEGCFAKWATAMSEETKYLRNSTVPPQISNRLLFAGVFISPTSFLD
jgi:hypothetical protein